MARKKTAVKPSKKSMVPDTSQGDIPEGFTMPATAQVPNWDFEKKKVLRGVLVNIKVVKTPKNKNKKTSQLMVVREESGNLLQVWESAALEGLFSEVKKGYSVFIRFDGYGEKVKGRNPMKLFTTAYSK